MAGGDVASGAVPFWGDGLLESGFGSPVAAGLMSWRRRVAVMLDIEAALAAAHADVGLLDEATGIAVARACDPGRLDLDALAVAAATAASPVIPLLAAVRAAAGGSAVETAAAVADGLHLGATSQDIIDTTAVLQIRAVLDHLSRVLDDLAAGCARLADAHRHTVGPGRTLGQQAVPVTFGLKAARWLGAVDRRIEGLRELRPRLEVVQLGGAAGTLAAFDGHGSAVATAFAARLDLGVPDLPWHAERDRVVDLAGALAGVATTAAHIAAGIVALAATEVGEVHAAAGPGTGSSAMPHKRNPTDAVAARAAARLALGEITVVLHAAAEHEHERAAGAWQSEWVALPGALVRTVGAAERTLAAVMGLRVDPDQGRRNLDAGFGLTAAEALAGALRPALGRPGAAAAVGDLAATAAAQRLSLRDVAATDPRVREVLPGDMLDTALAPARSLREVDAMIDRALATDHALRSPGAPGKEASS